MKNSMPSWTPITFEGWKLSGAILSASLAAAGVIVSLAGTGCSGAGVGNDAPADPEPSAGWVAPASGERIIGLQ